uniref:Uncharacterized protein n=1 Tax=Solanum tuberosum TaxID=4113 RepID=M1AVQ9_SOLTU
MGSPECGVHGGNCQGVHSTSLGLTSSISLVLYLFLVLTQVCTLSVGFELRAKLCLSSGFHA